MAIHMSSDGWLHNHLCCTTVNCTAACTGSKVKKTGIMRHHVHAITKIALCPVCRGSFALSTFTGRRGVKQHNYATHTRTPVGISCVAACAKDSRQFYIYLYFCRYSFETYQYNIINMALSQALRCSVLRSAIPLACSPVCRRVSASAAPHFAAQSHCLRTSAFVPSLSAFRPKVRGAASLWSRHSFYACSIDNGQPL